PLLDTAVPRFRLGCGVTGVSSNTVSGRHCLAAATHLGTLRDQGRRVGRRAARRGARTVGDLRPGSPGPPITLPVVGSPAEEWSRVVDRTSSLITRRPPGPAVRSRPVPPC